MVNQAGAGLPALVRSATGRLVEPILDWFHLSMRVQHVEQVMRGLCALEPPPRAPLDPAQIDVERLRHLLWNGDPEKACETLGRIVSWAKNASVLNDPAVEAGARRLVARCTELHAYIENNKDALIDYGQRCRAAKPISTSRAGGTVNQSIGECPHEQATADALVAPWSPSRAPGQGRGAGRTLRPPSTSARGVAPQVFDAPGDVTPGLSASQIERRVEVLLVSCVARVDEAIQQKMSVREIARDLVGAVAGLRDLAVPGLRGTGLQGMDLEGPMMDLLPAEPPTFAERRRARDMVDRLAKRLARGQAAFAS